MKIIRKIKTFTLVEWLIFCVIIAPQSPWFIWGYGLISHFQYLSLLALLVKFLHEKRLKGNKGVAVFFLLLFYFVIMQIFNAVHLSYLFVSLAFLMALRFSFVEGSNVIRILTSYIFISIIIPLPAWLFHQFVSPLPSFGSLDIGTMKGGGGSVLMENYLFFVTMQDKLAMRFYSWYDEPGVLGTLAPFILWANKFNLRDYRNIVIIIGGLFTFSMAFYFLTILGWLFTSRKSIKKITISIIAILIIGSSLYLVMEDNLAFQQSVVYRLTNYDDNGVESRIGYDRDQLWNRARQSGDLVFGLGSGALNDYGGISSSYKLFILEFGYIGCLVLFFAYFSMLNRRDMQGLLTLFLFGLSFMQRPQLFTANWFFLFSCIIMSFYNKRTICNKNYYRNESESFIRDFSKNQLV